MLQASQTKKLASGSATQFPQLFELYPTDLILISPTLLLRPFIFSAPSDAIMIDTPII